MKSIKAESSRICLLLLFAFIQYGAWAYEERRDTIILDGEVIYIRRREVDTNIDSLQNQASKDVTSAPVYKRKYLSFLIGADLSRVQNSTDLDSMRTLSDFLGHKKSYTINPVLAIHGTLMLTDQIGIYSGIGINRMRASVMSINENSLAPDSLRVRFENRNGSLWQYYNYPVDIGFETDTTEVGTIVNTISFYTLDIPVGGRFFLSPPQKGKKIDVYVDIGVNLRWRLTRYTLPANAGALVSETGIYRSEPAAQFASRPLYALAQFKLGAMFYLNSSWRLESQIQLNFPPYLLNSYEDYRLRFSNYNFSIGISRFFDGK